MGLGGTQVATPAVQLFTPFGTINLAILPELSRQFPSIPVTAEGGGFTFGVSQVTQAEVIDGYGFGRMRTLFDVADRLAEENSLKGDEKNRLRKAILGRVVIC